MFTLGLLYGNNSSEEDPATASALLAYSWGLPGLRGPGGSENPCPMFLAQPTLNLNLHVGL